MNKLFLQPKVYNYICILFRNYTYDYIKDLSPVIKKKLFMFLTQEEQSKIKPKDFFRMFWCCCAPNFRVITVLDHESSIDHILQISKLALAQSTHKHCFDGYVFE